MMMEIICFCKALKPRNILAFLSLYPIIEVPTLESGDMTPGSGSVEHKASPSIALLYRVGLGNDTSCAQSLLVKSHRT